MPADVIVEEVAGIRRIVIHRDNESQQSNGAGKSALLECIAVGITGLSLIHISFRTRRSRDT